MERNDRSIGMVVVVGLCVAALLVAVTGASSPLLSLDTYVDESLARECLGGQCTIYGIESSVPGAVHGAGWMHLRAFLEWTGLGFDGSLVVMLVSFVVSCGICIFVAGCTMGVRGAWYTAAVLFATYAIIHGSPLDELNNRSPLPFFGSVLLASAFAAARRPDTLSFAMLGLVVGVASNVHSQCGTALLSIVWLAMLVPTNRVWLAFAGVVGAVVASLCIAPAGWAFDLAHGLQGGSWQPGDPSHRPVGAVLAVGALVVAAVRQRRSLRGRSAETRDVLTALLAPALVPFVAMTVCGVIRFDTRYIVPVHAAISMALAAAIRGWIEIPGLPRRTRVRRAAAFGICTALLILWSFEPAAPRITFRDIHTIARELRDVRGWSFAQVAKALVIPHRNVVLPALAIVEKPWEATGISNDSESVLVLLVRSDDVPMNRPSSWRTYASRSGWVVLMADLRSWLDWSSIEICSAEGASACSRAGEFSNLAGVTDAGPVTARVRWNAPPGATETVILPQRSHSCSGRIIGVPAGSTIEADGRRAQLVARPGDPDPRIVTFAWTIDGDECRSSDDVSLPIVAAGPHEQLAQVLPLLERAGWMEGGAWGW